MGKELVNIVGQAKNQREPLPLEIGEHQQFVENSLGTLARDLSVVFRLPIYLSISMCIYM